ncbi:unnamed protein product [Lactuca virosa]|uniref:Uncharacterized protein n=1 Tax=Lactuca virosa TaxID=75947 RepID=A0AAU9LVQ9_9ASTR|nr:unnamed protein product [Lactuca virosa]
MDGGWWWWMVGGGEVVVGVGGGWGWWVGGGGGWSVVVVAAGGHNDGGCDCRPLGGDRKRPTVGEKHGAFFSIAYTHRLPLHQRYREHRLPLQRSMGKILEDLEAQLQVATSSIDPSCRMR